MHNVFETEDTQTPSPLLPVVGINSSLDIQTMIHSFSQKQIYDLLYLLLTAQSIHCDQILIFQMRNKAKTLADT